MRFSELEGARVGVWGAGREIVSFATQLQQRLPAARIAVAVFDGDAPADVAGLLHAPEVRVVSGERAVAPLSACELLVRSPGVSIHRPELVALREGGLPVTTATSLWLAERAGGRTIGVTGTKGKSTTAALAHALARAAGEPAELAGNIGRPALDLLDADPATLVVLELSSYQIADLAVGPEIAVLTNLYPEHADWHGSEQSYRAEKLRLLELPGVAEAVLPARSPELAEAPGVAARRLFGLPGGWDLTAEGGVGFAGRERIAREELPLRGEHNALNLCAALTALEAAGVEPPELPAALARFEGLAHRLQVVAERDGVLWVDDSISTTPESALAALASFAGSPIVLLGGGQDRGQDYSALVAELRRLDGTLIATGSTGPRMLQAARDAGLAGERALAAEDLAAAVAAARRLARPGSVVLLSPAAPSYDSFENFERRGELFTELVSAG